jgi:hypothetical protein
MAKEAGIVSNAVPLPVAARVTIPAAGVDAEAIGPRKLLAIGVDPTAA